jgi:SOS response regulatory protein OraA/RecX
VSNEAALRYIRSAIVNGQSRDHIRARLKENGFTDEEIDDLFEGYDRDHKPTDSMDDGPP